MFANFQDLVQGAEEALAHNDLEEARARFEAALVAKPYPCAQKSRVYRRLGEIAYRAGDLPVARRHLEAAEEGYSGHCCNGDDRQAHVDALVMLAHICRDQGDNQASFEALARARWRDEQMVLDSWKLTHQLTLLGMALLGGMLGKVLFSLLGLPALSWLGSPLLLIILVAGFLSGALLAIVLTNLAVPLIVQWRLKRAQRRLKLRQPMKIGSV